MVEDNKSDLENKETNNKELQNSFNDLGEALKEYKKQRQQNASDRAERDKIYRLKNRLKVLVSDAISRAKKHRY